MARKGLTTVLCTRDANEAEQMNTAGQNARFLAGYEFPPTLSVSADMELALATGCRMIVFATPSGELRANLAHLRPMLEQLLASPQPPVLLSASKGLELQSLLRMTEVIEQELPQAAEAGLVCALSGPNLSKEVAGGKPGATVIAGRNLSSATQAQRFVMTPTFRVYTNPDVIGVELGGALKNIIALGAGLADGLKAGDNAKGAFITRGMAEIGRLGAAAGADPLTFLGLAGLGDMIATCASPFSRNRFVGQELAKGRSLDEIRAGMTGIAEGVSTTAAARRLAAKYGVEMPITEQLYQLLFAKKSPLEAIADLMMREPTQEMYGFKI
jgi:glycerol-3-phosphate dehydrogenase (NAD(P)+)